MRCYAHAEAATPSPSRPPPPPRVSRRQTLGFDKQRYGRRNAIERCFAKLKQWRGLATRYDKTATNYRGGLLLATLLMWTQPQQGDTP